ncbi:hypothetical protein ASPCAL00606 [Aspergillus calidoustus]|uniref:Molybdenum cofactor biosynthesis protein F N-terminal domain-containing protein n=1 Tax=Aspergillus calidoustus TaxID=454130 RepID=A0A0U5FPB5_ASPCI|nr:hypothetical protein ASPCAL00606 [Aspergillus calidoustus]
MAESRKLSDAHLNLVSPTELIFHTTSSMTDSPIDIQSTKERGTAPYKAFEVRANIYLIDFNKPNYEEQVSLVASLSTGQVLGGISGFHDIKEGCKRTWTSFSDASIDGYADVTPFAPTAHLISKHILYRYVPRDGTSTSTQIRRRLLGTA